MFGNSLKPDAGFATFYTARFLYKHGKDPNLAEDVEKNTNRLVFNEELSWLKERGECEKRKELKHSGKPSIRFELEVLIKANGFNRIVGRFGNKRIIVMVPYELVDINTVQEAVKDIPEFKAYVDKCAIKHKNDAEWNACPIMLINDFGDEYEYELHTVNLEYFKESEEKEEL